MNLLCSILVWAGVFFLAVSSLGVLRLPDLFTRVHAAGKADTLGVGLVMVGLALHHGLQLDSFKMLLIPVFVALANPVATHALVRAAWRTGHTPHARRVTRAELEKTP
jgi:multicomponent Na+:H+ antiporter subunit G